MVINVRDNNDDDDDEYDDDDSPQHNEGRAGVCSAFFVPTLETKYKKYVVPFYFKNNIKYLYCILNSVF